MSKHTPGPWEWAGSNFLYGGPRGYDEILAARDDGKPYGMHSALIDHHWDQEQAIANARLIAAAPDLIEALIVLRGACAAAGWLTSPVHIEHMDIARAAIAKATGETA